VKVDIRKSLIYILISLAIVGVFVISITLIIYYKYSHIGWFGDIDKDLFGVFGEFIGGVVGTLFSMVTTILVYLTYKSQQNDVIETKKLLDLTQNPDQVLHDYEFDGIILDAPCSGSGTWGRTPEMIAQFNPQKIEFFQKLQQNIARNVVKFLKPGKPLIYITCSAFKAENEDVVEFLVKELGLKLEEQQVLKGYTNKADTMFVARLSPQVQV